MAALRVRRTWWISQRPTPEVPLFRLLARRWRPVDHSERNAPLFPLALPAPEPRPLNRGWFGPKRPIEARNVARKPKQPPRWSPWMWIK